MGSMCKHLDGRVEALVLAGGGLEPVQREGEAREEEDEAHACCGDGMPPCMVKWGQMA